MKVFRMYREHDDSGVSGTGHVLDGVVFDNGVTVVCWHTEEGFSSVAMYPTYDKFKSIHVDPHPANRTWFEEAMV